MTAEQIEHALKLGERIYQEELLRSLLTPLDYSGIASVLEQVGRGLGEAELRAWVRESDEWKEKHPPYAPLSRLKVEGRKFLQDDKPFIWSGLTAFALASLLAQGKESEAIAYMDWAKERGFNLLRTLSMCEWLDLTPEAGREQLSRILELADQRGLYVEIVALSDTALIDRSLLEIADHIRALGEICRAHPNSVLEIANEPYHSTHASIVHESVYVTSLTELVPSEVPVATGASLSDEETEKFLGTYITRHLDRTRDPWNMIRRVRELEKVSDITGRPVVNDEPIGAGEEHISGKRLTDPAIFFTMGVLGRIMTVGTTFHLEAGLRCGIPGPVQTACADAFIAGSRIIPDDILLTFKNSGWADSPIKSFDETKTIRAYSGLGEKNIVAILGRSEPDIQWQNGYSPKSQWLASYPGIAVWEIVHQN